MKVIVVPLVIANARDPWIVEEDHLDTRKGREPNIGVCEVDKLLSYCAIIITCLPSCRDGRSSDGKWTNVDLVTALVVGMRGKRPATKGANVGDTNRILWFEQAPKIRQALKIKNDPEVSVQVRPRFCVIAWAGGRKFGIDRNTGVVGG